MFTPSQIRKLKFAVIGMGAILLAGFALSMGRNGGGLKLLNLSSGVWSPAIPIVEEDANKTKR